MGSCLIVGAAVSRVTAGSVRLQPDPIREIVEEVAAVMTDDYRKILLPRHYDALRQARQTKQIVPDEVVQQLLANQSLLEYRNRVFWCDVHPVVRELVDSP